MWDLIVLVPDIAYRLFFTFFSRISVIFLQRFFFFLFAEINSLFKFACRFER